MARWPSPETDPVAAAALASHQAVTTAAHGGIVSATDAKLFDARAPTVHGHPQADVTGLAATLGAKADLVGGKIPTAQVPAVATGETVTVASQAGMLALTAAQVQPGDVAIRSDQSGRRWVLAAADPSALGSWIALEVPDAVSSVQGQQGAVILGKADLGLANVDNTADAAKPVSVAQQAALDAKAAAAALAVVESNAEEVRAGLINQLGYRTVAFADNTSLRNLDASSRMAAPNLSATYKTTHTARVTATGAVKLVFANIAQNAEGDGPIRVRASIQVGATFYQAAFAGSSALKTLAAGEIATTDTFNLVLSAGDVFHVWTHVEADVAGRWPYNAATAQGFYVPGWAGGYAYGADLTPAGGTITPGGVGAFGPSLIIGEAARPSRSVLIVGDSIAHNGTLDSYIMRALRAGSVPWVADAQPSDNLAAWNVRVAQRSPFFYACTDVICELGTNDFSTTAGMLATVQARMLTAWGHMANGGLPSGAAARRVYQTTITPYVTGTSGAQVLAASTTDKQALNAWLRAGAPVVAGVAVAVGTSGALRAGDREHPLTGYIEVADTLESPKRSGYWATSAFSDGVHPVDPAGHALAQSAVDPAAFGKSIPPALTLAGDATGPTTAVVVSKSTGDFTARPGTTAVKIGAVGPGGESGIVLQDGTDAGARLYRSGVGVLRTNGILLVVGYIQTFGDLYVSGAGKGLRVKEGENCKQGVATLVAGTVTVANTTITATSRILLTAQDNSSTGALRVSARTAGASFVITSSNPADAGVVAYQIFEPV